MTHRFAIRPAVLSLAVLAATASCGSDSTAPKSNSSSLSAAEATTVASAMFEQISLALSKSGGLFVDRAAPFGPSAALVPTGPLFAAAPLTGTVQVTSACTLGGTITGTYTWNETINNDGSGSASGNFATTIANCQVSTGTRTIAVNGNLTYTFNMTLASNASLDTFNWQASGNFNWSGGSCSLNYTIAYVGTGKETITGSICGVNINETAG